MRDRGSTKVIPLERVSKFIVEQNVDLPAPQIMEEIIKVVSNLQDVPVHGRFFLSGWWIQSVENHVRFSMKEIVPEMDFNVRKFSSQDRTPQRTVEQIFDASVVEVIASERICERYAVSFWEEPRFSSRDQPWNRMVAQFSTLLFLTLLLLKFLTLHKNAVLSEWWSTFLSPWNRCCFFLASVCFASCPDFYGSKFSYQSHMLQRSEEQIL